MCERKKFYYFLSIISGTGNVTKCKLTIGGNATIVRGNFDNTVINNGKISGGYFYSSSPLTNHGTIIDGLFVSAVSNESEGKIENGTFRSTVTNNGIIKGGIFSEQPAGGTVASGYTLNINFPENGSYEIIDAGISYFGNSGYVIPNSNHNTSISIYIFFRDSQAILFPIDVTFGETHCLLEDWAPSARYYDNGSGYFSVTFTAPHADADTVTLSILTRLVIDKAGYPVGTEGGTRDYSGNGWKFEKGNGTLTLESGNYNFSGEKNALHPLNPAVQLKVKSGATLTGGAFKNEPTGEGAGTFRTVTLNGTGSITAVNGLASGDWGNKLYAVKTGNNTITASEPIRDINRILLENDDPIYPNPSNKKTVCINIQQFLNSVSALDPEANIILNQASYDLPLIMASNGTPVIVNAPFEAGGGHYTYYGDGWHIQKSFEGIGTLYLTGGKTYNFRSTDPVNKKGEPLNAVICSIVNEGGIIEDGTFSKPIANGQPGSTSSEPHEIEGGTFAAGLLYNDGTITGGAFNGKDSILPLGIGLSGNYRSVTVKDGAIVKVNDTFPLVYDKTTHDLVQGSAWDLYSYAGTVLTVKADADITNINGQKIGEAFSSYYLNGETDKKVVRFVMPDSDVELNSTKIVVPEPKPEPKPDPEPEAPTYTLTVKGGTFTYNGGEAMTSASVPVDAEVKVTLNQSAVPEGMVFDLWAMDGASLLGNPAVAYNEESFTIPAGSVAKGSTVTVEAQYRDATIESEPSVLGTAAIIGVAGAGTAVIVWQGYRIGMELYEKYFQPTPEETAAEQPAPEALAAAAS
ncbi:hypothetical protein FAEPRAA2165_00093 [Faecalibacterium duncaniae]|uniref:Bacterial repeat domain-containing protein n=1 Tax=Faecalibacterium duncaniae (strain DSM 17677 / JCM 31915 / A2-165) TaxID=411483 RepID=C7H1F5_FAED2|nr:hypothetical protein FAEPRAA2165_00093 [Faecalibacterium duncaniae]